MKRHVLFIPAWYPTSINPMNGIFIRDRVMALRDYGHRVGVIAPQQYSLRSYFDVRVTFRNEPKYYLDDGIPTYRHYHWAWLPKVPYGNSRLWIKAGMGLFERYISEYGRPDIIHANCVLMAGILSRVIKKKYDIPVVLQDDGNAFDSEHYKFPFWLNRMVDRSVRDSDEVVAVSHKLAERISERCGISPDDIKWIPNIVEDVFFETPLINRKERDFTFFAAGNFNTNKGHADLIDAFTMGFRERRDIKLRIVGQGPNREKLLAQCKALGVEGQIEFLGQVDRNKLAHEMANCNVFVLPSRYEAFGAVVAEALACGTPVIATKCFGPMSVVKEHCGILVPSRDPKSMSLAMTKMVDDAKKYDPASLRKYSYSLFSAKAVAERTTSVYEEVLSRSKKGNN